MGYEKWSRLIIALTFKVKGSQSETAGGHNSNQVKHVVCTISDRSVTTRIRVRAKNHVVNQVESLF